MSDLPSLLAQREGKTLEFKRDASSPGPIMKTLVAFANGSGGTLLVGVEEIKRQASGRSFDEDPLPEMNTEALDFLAASQCFAPFRKLTRADLKALNLVTRSQNRDVPTVGGILLFGKDRLAQFPDAHLRAGVFAGTDRTRILDSLEIKSYLPKAVEEAIHFIQRNTRIAIEIKGVHNERVPEFPLIALREAVINAVVHTDYAQRGSPLRVAVFSDRIEIDNPGGLPPGLTLEELRQGVSKLRNRVIGRVFHELKLIEQWGSGIQRMTRACMEAGLPEPLLEEIGAGFRVTFGLKPILRPEVDTLDQAILDLLVGTPGLSTSQIASQIQRTPRAARDRLNRLVGRGLIVEHGSSAKDPKKVFRLAVQQG